MESQANENKQTDGDERNVCHRCDMEERAVGA